MTEAQALDAKIDTEADKIRAEILSQANQNMEYGSIIYVDADGQIRHTPLLPSVGDSANLFYDALPDRNGQNDYSTVLAVVHSHPQYIIPNPTPDDALTDSRDPDKLLTPSIRTDSDDWSNFDGFINLISAQGGDAAHFSTYILGHNGSTMVLNQYFADDRNTTTSASGDFVSVGYDPGIHCDYF